MADPTPKPAPSPAEVDPWNTVKKSSDLGDFDRLKVLIYGPNGNGKSTTAARFHRPLIGLTEMQAIPAIKEACVNPMFKVIQTFKDLQEFFGMLANHPEDHCDAVILDSLSDIQTIIKDHFTGMQRSKTDTEKGEKRDITNKDTWGLIQERTRRLVRLIRDVKVHACVVCLDKEISEEGMATQHRPSVYGGTFPSELGQYFNLVGYQTKQQRPNGLRREVMFEGDTRWQVKGMTRLDHVEPPEPMLWAHKRFGTPIPTDKDATGKTVMDRVEEWRAMNPEITDMEPSQNNSPNTDTADGSNPLGI